MPNYDALAGMMSRSDPALELNALREKRKAELENRAAMGTDPRASGLLRLLTGQMNEDPDTGLNAQADVKQIEDAQQKGKVYNLDENKQVRDDTQRTALERILKPVEAKGKYDLERQKIASEGVVRAARETARGKRAAGGGGTTGGAGKLASGLMERVAGGSNANAIIQDLRGMRGGVTTGPIAGRAQSFAQKIPLLPGTKEFAKFKAGSDALLNTTIKAITGAQMSEPEAVRIRGQVPSENDKDEVWHAKAEMLEKMNDGMNIRIGLLQRGVPAEVLNAYPIEELQNHLQDFQGGGQDQEDDLGPEWGGR